MKAKYLFYFLKLLARKEAIPGMVLGYASGMAFPCTISNGPAETKVSVNKAIKWKPIVFLEPRSIGTGVHNAYYYER